MLGHWEPRVGCPSTSAGPEGVRAQSPRRCFRQEHLDGKSQGLERSAEGIPGSGAVGKGREVGVSGEGLWRRGSRLSDLEEGGLDHVSVADTGYQG